MRLKSKFLVGAILLSYGCATTSPPSSARSPLPANLVEPCPNLTPLNDATGGAVLRKLIEVSEQYYECQRRHRALADAIM